MKNPSIISRVLLFTNRQTNGVENPCEKVAMAVVMIGSKPFSNRNNWFVTNNSYSMYSARRVSYQDGGLWFVVCLLITCFSNNVLYVAGRAWWLIEASQMHVLWCVFVERRPIGSLSASVFCRRRTALWQTLSRSNSAAPSQCRCRVSGIAVASRRRNGRV